MTRITEPTRQVNPYIAGNPIREDSSFFGRERTLDRLNENLCNPHNNAIIISGQRRIGKTSLLHKLERTLSGELFFCRYFDLMDMAQRPLGEVLLNLADTLARKLDMPDPESKDFDNLGRFFVNKFLPEVYRRLNDLRLVFLLDEFEVVDQAAKNDLVEGAAAITLNPFLRRMMGTEPQLVFIFTVGRADDLSMDVKTTFRNALQHTLWVLDPASAEALIRQGEAEGPQRFKDEGVQHILDLTNGHPYLTQLLCQCIWERSYQRYRHVKEVVTIDASVVETAVEGALELGENALDYIWRGLTPPEMIFAAAVGEIADLNQIASEARIIERITEHSPEYRNREVEQAGDRLIKRQILKEIEPGCYRFEIEMLRRWIQHQRSLRKVGEELDRLEPEAEALFGSGENFYYRKDWHEAAGYFRRALEINSDHYRAHLLLGETLLMMNSRKQAVSEMEAAYRLNSKGAQMALSRALAQYAEEIQSADENQALAICDRSLRILPGEVLARRIQADIWTRRGDLAFKQENVDAALGYFRKARNTTKLGQVEEYKRQRKEEIESTFRRSLLVVKAAEAAAGACQRSAASAFPLRSRGIWLAAARVFKQEAEMCLHLAEGLAMLGKLALSKDKKLLESQDASKKLRQVKRILPNDDRREEGESETSVSFPDRENLSGVKDPAARLTLQEMEKLRQRYDGDIDRAIERGNAFNRALAQAIGDCRLRIGSQDDRLRGWALHLLEGKQRAVHTYVEGMHALRQEMFSAAERIFGWAFESVGLSEYIADTGRKSNSASPSAIWQMKVMAPSDKLELWLDAPVTRVAFSADGEFLATASTAGVRIWRLEEGELLREFANSNLVKDLAFTPDGTALAVAFDNGYVKLWSTGDGRLIHTFKHQADVLAIRFLPGGEALVCGSGDRTISFWDLADGRLRYSSRYRNEAVQSNDFSFDCSRLATGSTDRFVQLWYVANGKPLGTLKGHEGTVGSVAFSPTGEVVASGSDDKLIRLWRVIDGRLVGTLGDCAGRVTGLAFSPDGRMLASSSSDEKVRIWDVVEKRLIHTVEEPAAAAATAAFSPDSKRLACGTWDDTVRLWSTADGKLLRTLGPTD
ncbi:MAG: AAA family ATPase [bacterium]|nr:AAA family ATPase [bacterium]